MKIRIDNTKGSNSKTALQVIILSKHDLSNKLKKPSLSLAELNRTLGKNASEVLSKLNFTGKHLQTAYVAESTTKYAPVTLLVGFEHNEKDSSRARLDRFRALGAKIIECACQLSSKDCQVFLDGAWVGDEAPLEALIEGLILTSYEYNRYKTKKDKKKPLSQITLLSKRTVSTQLKRRCEVICEQVCFARDLINTPPNDLRPTHLANLCKDRAKTFGLRIEVLDTKKLTALGAWGILCVGMGSGDNSYLISLHYKPTKVISKKKVALVGKAVTFDSGGLVIKNGMSTMKCDMSGGAAVLSAMCAIAALKLPIEVSAYIPITENMINGDAVRPGDIFTLLSGKTVEVLNTDAEGRLILADALHYALRKKPDIIIDLATLTGACAVALGTKYAGLFSNNDDLADALIAAGDLAGEPLWRLPLAPEYKSLIYSSVADYKNLFKEAGAVTAALFLEEFVNNTTWAHLDIAGPAFTGSDEGFIKAGGVGFGVRTILRFIEELIDLELVSDSK